MAPAEQRRRRRPSSEPYPRNAAARRCVLRGGLRAARVPRASSSPHTTWHEAVARTHRVFARVVTSGSPLATYARIPRLARLSRASRQVTAGSNPRDGLGASPSRLLPRRVQRSSPNDSRNGSNSRALTALLESWVTRRNQPRDGPRPRADRRGLLRKVDLMCSSTSDTPTRARHGRRCGPRQDA